MLPGGPSIRLIITATGTGSCANRGEEKSANSRKISERVIKLRLSAGYPILAKRATIRRYLVFDVSTCPEPTNGPLLFNVRDDCVFMKTSCSSGSLVVSAEPTGRRFTELLIA